MRFKPAIADLARAQQLLSDRASRLYTQLLNIVDWTTGETEAGIAELAALMARSESTVQRAKRELIAHGLVTVEEQGRNGIQTVNKWSIVGRIGHTVARASRAMNRTKVRLQRKARRLAEATRLQAAARAGFEQACVLFDRMGGVTPDTLNPRPVYIKEPAVEITRDDTTRDLSFLLATDYMRRRR